MVQHLYEVIITCVISCQPFINRINLCLYEFKKNHMVYISFNHVMTYSATFEDHGVTNVVMTPLMLFAFLNNWLYCWEYCSQWKKSQISNVFQVLAHIPLSSLAIFAHVALIHSRSVDICVISCTHDVDISKVTH